MNIYGTPFIFLHVTLRTQSQLRCNIFYSFLPPPNFLSCLSAARSSANPRPTTMQRVDGGQCTPMGRDPISKWVHWLAHSRRSGIGSTLDTMSSNSLPSSLFQSCSNAADCKLLPSRSITTSYFALLSANEHGLGDGRLGADRDRQHGRNQRLTARDVDSSWVACFAERWHQRQPADVSDETVREKAHSPEQPVRNGKKTLLSPTETQRLKPQNNLSPGPENAVISDTDTATSPMPDDPSSEGPVNPLPSSLFNLWDFDIDSLSPELLPDFDSFGSTNTPANGAYATAMPNDGDLTWLEEPHAFPFNKSDESKRASSTSRRIHEEYPGDYTYEGQTGLECNANKRQRILYS